LSAGGHAWQDAFFRLVGLVEIVAELVGGVDQQGGLAFGDLPGFPCFPGR
jgi:hypothetical protein